MKTLKEIFGGLASKNEGQQSHSCCGGRGHSHHQNGSSQSETEYYNLFIQH